MQRIGRKKRAIPPILLFPLCHTLLFSLIAIFAQSPAAASPVHDTNIVYINSGKPIQPGPGVCYYRDPSGRQDPSFPDRSVCIRNREKVISAGYTTDAIWIPMELHKLQDDSDSYYLIIADSYINHSEIFYRRDDQYILSGTSGRHIPLSLSALPARGLVYPIHFDSHGIADVRVRFQTEDVMLLPLEIVSEKEYVQAESRMLLFHGLYLGAAIAMIVYNAFLLAGLRDKTYLYYVLFVASLATLVMADSGYLRFWFLDSYPYILKRIIPLSVSSGSVWGLLFARSLLNVKEWSKLYYNLYFILILMFATTPIYLLLVDTPSTFPVVLLTLFNFFLNMWVTVHALLRKNRTALFFLIAYSTFFAGLFLFVFMSFNIIPYSLWIVHGYKIGSSLEMLLLSLALADRINALRKDREEARQEVVTTLEKSRRELEQIVTERTRDLLHTNEELRSSLEENRILLREVHHRVKNNLQVMLSFLTGRSGGKKDSEKILTGARNRIKAISMIHSRFYQSDHLSEINFSEFVHLLVADIARVLDRSSLNIRYSLENVHLDLEDSIACGLILNELLTNAFKHGEKGEVDLTLTKRDSQIVVLRITNSSTGPVKIEGNENDHLSGLSLVKDLVQHRLKGNMAVRYVKKNRLLTFEISFPTE